MLYRLSLETGCGLQQGSAELIAAWEFLFPQKLDTLSNYRHIGTMSDILRTDAAIDELLKSLFPDGEDTKSIQVISWSGGPDYEKGSLMDMLKNNPPSISD